MSRLIVIGAVVLLTTTVADAADIPTIETDGDAITVTAQDLQLKSSTFSAPISMAALAAQVANMSTTLPAQFASMVADMSTMKSDLAALQAVPTDTFATGDDVADAIEAAAAGLQTELLANTATTAAATNGRVDQLVADLAGFDQTRTTVGVLAKDMKYVLAHMENATACAKDGTVHSGAGECVDPIPSCPKPEDLDNGGVLVMSSSFIIPGVTAKYTCPKDGTFLRGPAVRVCSEETAEFTGESPACLACKVLNCELCVGADDTCGVCAYGHDLTENKKSCDERKDTIIVLEGGVPMARHNYNSMTVMAPNSNKWTNLFPNQPYSSTNGMGALIKGTIYTVNRDYRSGTGTYNKLAPGSTMWTTFPAMGNGADITVSSFFATLNGQGTKEDGFYIFGITHSGVFKPDDDAWTQLPLHSDAGSTTDTRSKGATVAIGKQIYLLGGYTTSRKVTDRVDIFDANTRKFSTGVPMTTARCDHAAATYGGKIFVFGGSSTVNVAINTVEMFDPSSGKWATLAGMPDVWSEMTTGPLPVFANGEVMIPHAYRHNKGIAGSLKYDTVNDSWEEGPRLVRPVGRYVALMGSLE